MDNNILISTVEKKRVILQNIIKTGHTLKDKYFKKMCQYNSVNNKLDTIILTTSTIGTTLIISSLPTINPVITIIGVTFTAISAIISSIQKGIDTRNKYESYRNTFLQLNSLISQYNSKLIQNNISSDDYSELIDHYNTEYQLIIEGSLPIR
jgi:hypothetical protein